MTTETGIGDPRKSVGAVWFDMNDDGRLDLDAPVGEYVDYLRAPGNLQPSVRQLLTHTAGLGTVAFTAFIARATDPRYTATQFALFTSLASVPRSVVNATTGWIVEQTGWYTFFLLCTALALPGMALLLRVAPWNEPVPGGPPEAR